MRLEYQEPERNRRRWDSIRGTTLSSAAVSARDWGWRSSRHGFSRMTAKTAKGEGRRAHGRAEKGWTLQAVGMCRTERTRLG